MLLQNLTKLRVLILDGLNMSGIDVSCLMNLSISLEVLSLSSCKLRGMLAANIFLLPKLTCLNLSDNKELAGYLPESTWNSFLKVLDLSSTGFPGALPESVGDLHSLEILWLYQYLDLSDNILSLSNSKNVDHVLPNLSKVSLSGCNITVIPAFLRNLTTVEYIDPLRDIIHSDIPPWMWDVGTESLSYLNLSHNFLTSFEQVPWEILVVLDLDSNLIQGLFLPQSLPNSVLIFLLARNQVTGHIPGSICEMKGLQILDFSHNNFAGTIPHCLGNLSESLLVLDQQENGFSGRVSLTFGKDAALKSFYLNENKFEGLLPRSVINCKQLEELDLSGNKLNDTFPKWLEILPSLRVLLRILDVSSNELTGPLPNAYFVNLKAMMSTDQDGSELPYMDQGYCQDSMSAIMKGLDTYLPKILVIRTTIDQSSNKFQGMITDVIGELNKKS
ncbi:receptor-like protein 43 [Eucalyptus grandis]|uniref:receptor-like protein 43 n=1 Tax=Eucalyptus grandis TaxID=71139 RepID=UPI00192EC9B9|nr:receptor-like protein 43 [Eucalyptus grandis]